MIFQIVIENVGHKLFGAVQCPHNFVKFTSSFPQKLTNQVSKVPTSLESQMENCAAQRSGYEEMDEKIREIKIQTPDILASLPPLPRSERPEHLQLFHVFPSPSVQELQRQRQESEAREIVRREAASWAQMTPLMAAIFGPLSILLGIPSLTQRWHGRVLDPPVLAGGISNFDSMPDPVLELVLSGVSLLFEVLANTLLVLRFSNIHGKLMTWISYFLWISKLVLDMANYIQFGLRYPETGDIIYLQGFWVLLLSEKVYLTYLGGCLWHGNYPHHYSLPHLQSGISPPSK